MTNVNIYRIIIIVLASTILLSTCTAVTPTSTQVVDILDSETVKPSATFEPQPSATLSPTKTAKPSPTPAMITISDGLGREITLAEPAQKIASLAASNTEILFAIGAGEQVVARDAFSDFPEAAMEVTDIGGGWGEIDTETLLSLDPDLVLAAEINAPEQVQALEELGLTVFYLANPDDIEGMFDNLLIVSALTGRESEAQALIYNLETRVAAIDEKIAGEAKKPLVFYELDGTDANAPWTSGEGTFIDLLIARAGGLNLGNVLADAWAQISIEELITQNPDIILLGDYVWGGVTPEDVASRAGWEAIAAVQNERVYPFDDNLVSRPGPRLVAGLEVLAELFHPEMFE